jgi:hypothetical protein
MSDKNTGGPAFPRPAYTHPNGEIVLDEDGMTLRDYFAAKAMQGMLASDVNATRHIFAAQAYAMADAMLETREA